MFVNCHFDSTNRIRCWSKAIQLIKFAGKLKKIDNNGNDTALGIDKSMFALTILKTIQRKKKKTSLMGV